jgi:hypothetical protein
LVAAVFSWMCEWLMNVCPNTYATSQISHEETRLNVNYTCGTLRFCTISL